MNTSSKSATSKTAQVRSLREQRAAASTQAPAASSTTEALTAEESKVLGLKAPATEAAPAAAPAATTGKKAKRSRAHIAGVVLAKTANRIEKRYASKFASWTGCDAAQSAAVACAAAVLRLREAAEFFAAVPADFAPKGTKGTKPEKVELVEGTVMRIRDKARKAFVDVLEPCEMQDLKVVKLIKNGKEIRVATTTNGTLILKRAQLEIQDAAEVTEEASAQ